MQTIVALLLVAVASVSASSLFNREKRTSGGSPLGSLASAPIAGGAIGTAAGAAGGLIGAAGSLSGHNDQAAWCTDGSCAASACTAQSDTHNSANGEGGLVGAGSVVGPAAVNLPVCAVACAQCNQVAGGILG